MSFKKEQYLRAENLIKEGSIFNGDRGNGFFKGKPYSFILEDADNNLFAPIIEQTKKYFTKNKIAWWGGKLANHTLSSQVACLNHLFPIRKDKKAILSIAKQFEPNLIEVLPISTDNYEPAFVQFEAVSNNDYLNELSSTRGSNCTSVDALIYGLLNDGRKIIFPIEWKYAESYSNDDKAVGEKGITRRSRYTELINDSEQLKSENHAVYYFEPFYQLMRQTLWAEQMIIHSKSEIISADKYLHIHVIPAGNNELLTKIYKCSKKPMEDTWRSCINDQTKYLVVTPKQLLSKVQGHEYTKFLEYLDKRYW